MCPRWCGRYNPRAHPASFQSPSWLTTPTSMLVRTHPYQLFSRRPVPSRLIKGGTDCKWSYLRYEVSLRSDAEYTCLGWYFLLASLRAGPGLPDSPDLRGARVPSLHFKGPSARPIPRPTKLGSPRPGGRAQACCFFSSATTGARLAPPVNGRHAWP